MLCYARPCQCVLSQPVATPHSRSVTPNRPTFAQPRQWGRFCATPKMFFFCVTFCEIELSLQSGAHFAHLISQKCSGFVNFFHILKCNSSSRYSPVHYLSTTAPERGSEPRKQTTLAIPGAILPKNAGFRTRECFSPVNAHASELLHVPSG